MKSDVDLVGATLGIAFKIITSNGSDEICKVINIAAALLRAPVDKRSPYHQRLCCVKSDVNLVGATLGIAFKIITSNGSDEIFTGFYIAAALLRAPVDKRSPYHQRLCCVKSDVNLVGATLGIAFKIITSNGSDEICKVINIAVAG